MKTELDVGSTAWIKGRHVRAVKVPGDKIACRNCVFLGLGACLKSNMKCNGSFRKDKTDIYYQELEKEIEW